VAHEQLQEQGITMPLQSTSGAASYDAFGGGVAAVPKYIEDVFSTFLWSGNGSAITINNGIDLSTKGGLVWVKARNQGARNHWLQDTARGITNTLNSDTTGAQNALSSNIVSSVTTTGFVDGASWPSGWDMASWSWAKAPKFFDVVTYSGSNSNQTISHNLGSAPGCIMIKKLDSNTFDAGWAVYHRSLSNPNNNYLVLNTTAATANYGAAFISSVSSTTFTVAGNAGQISLAGSTYVAYLFAHNAGGFGLTGTDNVISCGSFTSNGSGLATVNLGYEPQWVMVKGSSAVTNWQIVDNMRGFVAGAASASSKYLNANSSSAELDTPPYGLTSTGFEYNSAPSTTFIYIAIRRGPMKVPTSGTSVFNPVLASSTAPALRSSNFTSGVDSGIRFYTVGYPGYPEWSSRLTGTGVLGTSGTAAESTLSVNTWDYMNGYLNYAGLGTDFGSWMFKRAPSFFDEVCDSTGGPTIYHNLGVAPQLIIAKVRNYSPQDWFVDVPALGSTRTLNLNLTGAASSTNYISSPTATQFTTSLGGGGYNYVYYLFATCAGVSKVGSYTGTGATQTIDCGFTGGARFVLIKKTSGTGSWYVWDSARGIVSGNDPYLLLNSTAAEVTNTDYIDTYSAGFEISSTAPSAINATGGTFIFLAIA
jgi:hypothetical protein